MGGVGSAGPDTAAGRGPGAGADSRVKVGLLASCVARLCSEESTWFQAKDQPGGRCKGSDHSRFSSHEHNSAHKGVGSQWSSDMKADATGLLGLFVDDGSTPTQKAAQPRCAGNP